MIDIIAHQPPPRFFKRGPLPVVRLLAFTSFSFLLMVLDARFHTVDILRESLGTVMLGIRNVASYSVGWIDSIEEEITDRARLNEEIDKLRAQQYENRMVYTQIEYLTDENTKLRQLLKLQNRMSGEVVAAEVTFEFRDPFRKRVAIDKGSRQGIMAGQAVVSAQGLFGQVTRTYPNMSEITLIQDQDSAIPVQVLRNGLRTIAYGSTDGEKLELRYVDIAADIQDGDQIVTSGLDGIYLPGIPVGKVVLIDRRPISAFATVLCETDSTIRQQKHVLVITQQHNDRVNPFDAREDMQPDPFPPIQERPLSIMPLTPVNLPLDNDNQDMLGMPMHSDSVE
jgi:rod shape-determining protein MreC